MVPGAGKTASKSSCVLVLLVIDMLRKRGFKANNGANTN